MKRIILLVAIVVTLFFLVVGCTSSETEQGEFPQMVKSIDELPIKFNMLVTMGNSKFITRSPAIQSNYGTYFIQAGNYYEQVWLENQEDAIWVFWVFRDTTLIVLNGDIIRITTLDRRQIRK